MPEYHQRCSFCGHINSGEYPFCDRCQSELAAEGEPAIVPEARTATNDYEDYDRLRREHEEAEKNRVGKLRDAIKKTFGEEGKISPFGMAEIDIGNQKISLFLESSGTVNAAFKSTQEEEGSTKHSGAAWDYSAKELRKGSVEFAQKFRDLVGNLAKAGLGVSYKASEKRAAIYARTLERSGFEKSQYLIDAKGIHEATWKPKEMAEGGEVEDDPTKSTEPGGRDKIPAELEPGEVVLSKEQVAALRSTITTNAPEGLEGGLAQASEIGVGEIAQAPEGGKLAQTLGGEADSEQPLMGTEGESSDSSQIAMSPGNMLGWVTSKADAVKEWMSERYGVKGAASAYAFGQIATWAASAGLSSAVGVPLVLPPGTGVLTALAAAELRHRMKSEDQLKLERSQQEEAEFRQQKAMETLGSLPSFEESGASKYATGGEVQPQIGKSPNDPVDAELEPGEIVLSENDAKELQEIFGRESQLAAPPEMNYRLDVTPDDESLATQLGRPTSIRPPAQDTNLATSPLDAQFGPLGRATGNTSIPDVPEQPTQRPIAQAPPISQQLPGEVDEEGNVVTGSAGEDWSLPPPPTPPPLPTTDDGEESESEQESDTQPKGKGKLAKAPDWGDIASNVTGKLASSAIHAGTRKAGELIGLPPEITHALSQIMSESFTGYGGGRGKNGMLASILGGGGSLGETLAVGGGEEATMQSDELVDAIRKLTEAINKLLEKEGTQEGESFGPQPDGTFRRSLVGGTDRMAASSAGSGEGEPSASDRMMKLAMDAALRAAMA